MAARRSYSEVVIVGNGIELYWLALVCAQRIPRETLITFHELSGNSLPVLCAGPWLDDLHELMGVRHDDFLRLLKPRVCLGLDIQARGQQHFLPSAPTGMSYRGVPFARLYGAIGSEQSGPYTNYNYAHQLHQVNLVQPPRNVASAMCEGLQMDYVIKADLYRQFLIEHLRVSGAKINVNHHKKSADCQQDINNLLSSYAHRPGEVLLLDLTWGLASGTVEWTLNPHVNAGFFALNQLKNVGSDWLHSVGCDGERRLDVNFNWDWPLLTDAPYAIAAGGVHHIKLGSGRKHCLSDISRRIFFYQLRDLYAYWPEPDTFAYLNNKFNRTWQGWFTEADDFYHFLYSVLVGQESLSAANCARVELFREVGGFTQRDEALVQSWEWENLIVSCLGLTPSNLGLPRDINPSVVVEHMNKIRQSFAVR